MLPFGCFSYTSSPQVPALLVILVFLAFPRAPVFLVCCLGHKSTCVTDCGRVIALVNRLKIPQGLSTLLFHRWSEVPSRGGVRGDSPYEKLPASQRCHLSVFSECCFLELLARPSSIRTVFPSGFVVLFSIFRLCSSQSGFCRAAFQSERFILVLFPWPSSV